MKQNDRIRAYAAQRGIATKGSFKNSTTTNRLVDRLTAAQRRRIAKKVSA